ncbi:MAG: SUMF1/EgtB/PvdO family nonheme iron enzyme [Magnetococcales bacterium]|nr:SUMF1/EgtB/PvdO family nonheme iron enzyme [Magnetococcales bacterium]
MNSEPFSSALPPGSKLLWFEIIQVLGKGGFGITYLGRDTNQNQMVAIKEYLPTAFASRRQGSQVLPNSPEDKKTFDWGLDSFLKEAQIVARFRHPSIVRVVSFFRNANTAYMVMEYVEGEGLDAILKRRKVLPEPTIKRILPPLLDGLELLHKSAFIHRDLKPPNILIRADGTPVILDFGSARQAVAGQGDQMTSLLSLGYSPFEQYDSSGDRQGPWSDIYAMGGVLYRCIAGDKPIDASKRISARLRCEADPLVPATEIGKERYSTPFLQAIDWALMVLEKERPQTVREWRLKLLGDGSSGDAAPAADGVTTLRPPEPGMMGSAENGCARKKSSWRSFIASMNDFATQVDPDELQARKSEVLHPTRGDVTHTTGGPDGAAELSTRAREVVAEASPSPVTAAPPASTATPAAAPQPPAAPRKRGALWIDPLLRMEFLWLPGGIARIGSPPNEAGRRPEELPQREVRIEGFWISKYLMTWGRWHRVMGDYPPGQYRESKINHPVTRVSWNDVQKFLRQFNRLLGEHLNVRLPTEIEWEFAARASQSAPFISGDEDHWSMTDYAWLKSNSGGQSRPVGEKKPNDWGLYDMAGNVREWTEDRFQTDFAASRANAGNTQPGVVDEARVVRGSGFACLAKECRTARRQRVESGMAHDDLGFRLVRYS